MNLELKSDTCSSRLAFGTRLVLYILLLARKDTILEVIFLAMFYSFLDISYLLLFAFSRGKYDGIW